MKVRYWLVAGSHTIVDIYPQFFISLAVILKARLELLPLQHQMMYAVTPIFSGLFQPLFAWLGDRFNTRFFGPAGLALGAVCLSLIGFADSFGQLFVLQMLGMIGIGVYHPIGSAVAGALGAEALRRDGATRSARSVGLSIFFTAGMIGSVMGPQIATRLTTISDGWLGHSGLRWLGIMMIPGLLGAVLLWFTIRRVAHRVERVAGQAIRTSEPPPEVAAEITLRRTAVGLLFASNALRFTTNIGLHYVYGLWAGVHYLDEAKASEMNSWLLSSTFLGMAVTGLLAGWFIRPGREKWPMALSGLLTAPIIAAMPWLGPWVILPAAFLTAIGHFSVIPTSIALAQRLLPHATGWVGSLLMGCGWTVSAVAPFYAGYLNQSIGLEAAFIGVAALMALSGLLSLLLPQGLLERTVDEPM